MRGIICYESHEIARNQGFIDLWLRESARRGIALTLARLEETSFGLRDNAPYLRIGGQDAHPDFAVMRMKQPLLSRHLERMGVRVFNNAYTSEILNDKRRTHALFSHLSPMMDTAYITGDAPCPFDYPVVVKAAGGCGGRQVRLCGDEAAYRAAIREFSFQAVAQPLCDTPGRDLRVYMLGTACVQAMLRQSDSADFRSNFGLHHSAQPVEIPPEARRVACAVAEELRSALIGVDFIYDHGRLLFNEAEDAVGTRMLYQYTKLDIVRLYMDYIVAQMGE